MFYTLKNRSETSIEIKKSRFIAICAPVDSLKAAHDFIEKESVPDASHNCWAWKCGSEYRFFDDGEPGGTAGRPIYGVIEHKNLDNTVVLVIRYFGGIKLGAGGLVRAYSKAASKVLDQAGFVPVIKKIILEVITDQALSGAVLAYLSRTNIDFSVSYNSDDSIFTIIIQDSQYDTLKNDIINFTRGSAVIRIKEE
jgi:uncharacterized YigZ family protein